MKLSIRKPRLILGLFLVLALALGVTSMSFAAPQDGSGGGGGCYMTSESHWETYRNSPSCGGGTLVVYFNKEVCPTGWSWKQIWSFCQ